MTKEEAIKWLEYGKQGEMGKAVEAHDMAVQAIQALEDIRAEIEAYQSDAFYPNDVMMNKKVVLEIIDKYKAESEPQERSK